MKGLQTCKARKESFRFFKTKNANKSHLRTNEKALSKGLLKQFVLVFVLVLLILFLAITSYYALENPLNQRKIIAFAKYFLLWETLLAISFSYVFYRLFMIYEAYKREQEEFLSLLLKTLSHRFGNFISAQKIGLTMLAEECSSKRAKLLVRSCDLMEHDLRHLLLVLDSFLENENIESRVNIHELLGAACQQYSSIFGDKEIRISQFKEPTFFKKSEIAFILALLLENAYRYGEIFIWLRAGNFKGVAYLVVVNDIRKSRLPCGMGLGLYLARKFAARAGLGLYTREKRNYYFALLYERRTPRTFFGSEKRERILGFSTF